MSTTVFLWVIVCLMALDVIGRLVNVFRGEFAPARKARDYITDLVLNAMTLVWAILLVFWGKP